MTNVAEGLSTRTGDRQMTTTQNGYVLGSKDDELDRLDLQASYYRRATIDAMRWAGIEPGMKVLDIGSGTGAVAFEAARLVGPTGSVLGLDIAEVPVQTANERAVRLGLDNVSFRQADLATWQPTETFDALTGRLITMYLPNPSAVIASLSRALRPGGIVLLQEFAMSAARRVDGARAGPAHPRLAARRLPSGRRTDRSGLRPRARVPRRRSRYADDDRRCPLGGRAGR